MLKEKYLQGRVTVRALEGIEGTQIEDIILEDLARFGRQPSITVQPAINRLTDDQRKELDEGREFYGDFFFQAHYGDQWAVTIHKADILDRQHRQVAVLDVLNRDHGDPDEPSDLFKIDLNAGANRDSECIKRSLFFRPRGDFHPDSMQNYYIAPRVNAQLKSKSCLVEATEVSVGLGERARARAGFIHRLDSVLGASLSVALIIIILLIYYAGDRDRNGRVRQLVRGTILIPIKHWVVGFVITACLLLALGAAALTPTSMLTKVLGFIVMLVAVLSAYNILQRPKEEMLQLSREEIALFSLDAIIIPAISFILEKPFM